MALVLPSRAKKALRAVSDFGADSAAKEQTEIYGSRAFGHDLTEIGSVSGNVGRGASTSAISAMVYEVHSDGDLGNQRKATVTGEYIHKKDLG